MARIAIVGVLVCCALAGCDRPAASSAKGSVRHPTVASMVPACTDLILAMGAGDHLVAVSNYDTANPGAAGLPRVGDYLNTDWEKLAGLRPDVIVIQMKAEAVPQGLRERAGGMGAKLVNVEMETIGDVERVGRELGRAVGEEGKAEVMVSAFHARLDAVRARVKGRPAVRALVALDEGGKGVVGPGGFLDEVLHVAGGENAAASVGKRYATVDREKLVAMDPAVILQLLPGQSEASVEEAMRTWRGMPEIAAVRGGRVYTFTDWYVLTPGVHLADVAEGFARALHPGAFEPASGPAASGSREGDDGTERSDDCSGPGVPRFARNDGAGGSGRGWAGYDPREAVDRHTSSEPLEKRLGGHEVKFPSRSGGA